MELVNRARLPDLPPPERAAFLLDLDGTLLDIAPRPDLVVVPSDLPETLRRLRRCCGGALAVVTGRPIAEIDALLGDAPYAVAGEHGTAIRHAPGTVVERAQVPEPPAEWLDAAQRLAVSHPGVLFEPKAHGFVLHYRAAPELGGVLQDALTALVAEQPSRFELLAAKMAWEVKPRGVDKGSAVRKLMAAPPFAGRRPIYVGDDVTDEDGIRAAAALGGVGLRVPEHFPHAAAVRAWLAALASSADGADGHGEGWAKWGG